MSIFINYKYVNKLALIALILPLVLIVCLWRIVRAYFRRYLFKGIFALVTLAGQREGHIIKPHAMPGYAPLCVLPASCAGPGGQVRKNI